MTSDSVRAVRNNNPGNIRRSKDKWQGLAEDQDDQEFFTFKSPKWGFRAMATLLINYQDRYNLHTISGIVNRWAPPTENDTAGYVHHVCETTRLGAAEFLDLHKYADVAPLVKAIATHECGGWMFDDRDLDAGLRMAGVEPPAPSLASSRTMKAGTIGGAALMGDGLLQARDMLSEFSYLRIAQYGLIAIALLTVGITLYARHDDWQRARR